MDKRIKLFSHIADPDGLGCVVLASLVYQNLRFTLCKNNEELNLLFQQFMENKEYYDYDQIFITDLCLSDNLLRQIDSNEYVNLKNKLIIFDHHQGTKESFTKEYSFVTLNEMKDGKKCCGTSLFYEYLLSKTPLQATSYRDTFVLYTRLHDTYEWKEKNTIEAYQLQTLLNELGAIGYFYHFKESCLNRKDPFSYTFMEKEWMINFERKEALLIKDLLEHLVIKKEKNITYGAVIGPYQVRNSFAVSLRSLKEIPVLPLSKEYQGMGHPFAVGFPLTKENEQKLIRRFLLQ